MKIYDGDRFQNDPKVSWWILLTIFFENHSFIQSRFHLYQGKTI
jgi:hypothetical protein